MSIAAKDGAWVSEMTVSKFNCTRCGTFHVSGFPMNEREVTAFINDHIQKMHGGSYAS